LRLDDMHASLHGLKYRSPPLWCSIVIRCLCLLFKAFFVLLIQQLIRVLAFNSDACGVPIVGYPQRLLLLLFIKHDNTPKCGVAWFIMKEHNKSCISRILSRIVPC
jgi:hypothetical protein